jgi:hypothetical protein
MALHWSALLLGVLAVTPFAAEAALRVYTSHAAKPAQLFRSDDHADQRSRRRMENQN